MTQAVTRVTPQSVTMTEQQLSPVRARINSHRTLLRFITARNVVFGSSLSLTKQHFRLSKAETYQDDLPQRGGFLQSAPNCESQPSCLCCNQDHQQHKGSHDSLVHAATAEAESDVRHSLEVCHHINGARRVPGKVHPSISAPGKQSSDSFRCI